MVRTVKKSNKNYYICEVCGFAYEDREWAEKCQDHCSRYNACSLEITSHAVQLD